MIKPGDIVSVDFVNSESLENVTVLKVPTDKQQRYLFEDADGDIHDVNCVSSAFVSVYKSKEVEEAKKIAEENMKNLKEQEALQERINSEEEGEPSDNINDDLEEALESQ